MRRRSIVSLALAAPMLFAACGSDATSAPDAAPAAVDADPTPDAQRPDPGASLGSFVLTYYWVTSEDDYTGAANTSLYTPSCTLIATVPSTFADSLDLEGTGRLADGRLLNVDGACSCPRSPCYVEPGPNFPWGVGVQSRPLVPFRSVAVDHTVIPYGTSLYVEELDGVTMPGDPPWGGFVHDGCVLAADTGGGILGQHVDFFAGLRAAYVDLDGRLALDHVTVHDGGARCP